MSSVQPRRAGVKGPDYPEGTGSQARAKRRQAGPAEGSAGRLGADEDLEPGRPAADLILATRRLKSSGGAELSPTLADWDPAGEDRRSVPRHGGLVLTQAERGRLRVMLARASQCETRFIELRRAQPRPDGVVESRVVMPARCHVRICATCDQERRDREAVRLEGRWRTFWTMGIPADVFTVGRAWRKMSQWVGAFFRELRRAVRRGDLAAGVVIPRAEWRRIAADNAAHPDRRPLPALQYGWCLEPHQSGFPHVHWVTNARFVNRAWVLRTWSRIIRARCVWNHVRRVTSRGGVCRYLAKYQSKTVFPIDISAVLYKRRTWASTVPAEKPTPKGWERVMPDEHAALCSEVDNPELWARGAGWDVAATGDGSYAVFERFFRLSEWYDYAAERDRSLPEMRVRPADEDRALKYFEDHRIWMRTPREEGRWPERPRWTLRDEVDTKPEPRRTDGGGGAGQTLATSADLLTLEGVLW